MVPLVAMATKRRICDFGLNTPFANDLVEIMGQRFVRMLESAVRRFVARRHPRSTKCG